MAQSFKVPQSVSNNAKRGLELRKKHGRGGLTTAQAGAQGIGSGVARARDLIGGSVSLETIKRMSAFFDRHRKNKDTPPEKGNGMISWLLWGGDAGDRWAKGIIRRMEDKTLEEFKQWLSTTKPKGGSHGSSIKNPRVYEALRRQGYSKTAAARISNAQASKKAELTKSVAGRQLPASAFLVVGDPEKVTTWALPVRNADGSPDARRMGAAWAALHGGYRGNKYEGEGKAQAIAKLRRMYADQGRPVPGTTKARTDFNWGASAGETIGGSLARGEGGKFAGGGEVTGGESASDLEMLNAYSKLGVTKSDLKAWDALQSGNIDDVSTAALNKFKKLGFVDESGNQTPNGKAFTRAVKNKDATAIAALKPAKGGGGGGGGKKPKPTKAEVQAANISKVTQALSGSVQPEILSDMAKFSDGNTLPDASAKRLADAGLLTMAGGGYVATPEGKRLAFALSSGNVARARDAILRGRERAKKAAEAAKPSGSKAPAKQARKELNSGRMWVTTDKEGRYRWVAISSNSYQDREGEIVSQKALERAVERGDKGDLLWWHDHRAVIGSCDFQMIHGRMLIESGTFKSKAIGAAFAKVKGLGVSVGFARPANEPISGVYENIKIYERSALPAKRAANALTTFGVM